MRYLRVCMCMCMILKRRNSSATVWLGRCAGKRCSDLCQSHGSCTCMVAFLPKVGEMGEGEQVPILHAG